MTREEERRNLYRLLHVQPEAPLEVIRASYRTLMSTLRAHPDLGGDTARAARLNHAWETLSDPARRAEYDRALARDRAQARARAQAVPPGGAPAGAAASTTPPASNPKAGPAPAAEVRAGTPPPARVFDPAGWQQAHRCPCCAAAFMPRLAMPRCLHCDSPLTAAPAARDGGELLGRRGAPRHDRVVEVLLSGAALSGGARARLRDVSLTGLSVLCAQRVGKGEALRVLAPDFDGVALVVACRPDGAGWRLHARLLTLALVRSARGSVVSEKV